MNEPLLSPSNEEGSEPKEQDDGARKRGIGAKLFWFVGSMILGLHLVNVAFVGHLNHNKKVHDEYLGILEKGSMVYKHKDNQVVDPERALDRDSDEGVVVDTKDLYVKDLTKDNFKDWLAENEHAFVDLYAPWCVWCQRLLPVWESFAQEVDKQKMPVAVGKVDCMAEIDLCREQKIMAFPTIRWYNNGNPVQPSYNHDRTIEAMLTYAKDQLPQYYPKEDVVYVKELTKDNFKEWLAENEKSFVMSYAASILSAKKVSAKKVLPIWDSFAHIVHDLKIQVSVGIVDCEAEDDLCHEEDIRRYPTFRWYENGSLVDEYQSDQPVELRQTVKNLVAYSTSKLPGWDSKNWMKDNVLRHGGTDFYIGDLSDETNSKSADFDSDFEEAFDEANSESPDSDEDLDEVYEELTSATFKDWLSDQVDEQSIDLTKSNFKDWLAENQVTFINMYAPWCNWSRRLAPTWEKFAQEIQKQNMPVGVAKIDCSVEVDLCRDEQVMAFPTLRWYEHGSATTSHYRNERTVEAMIHFAKSKLRGEDINDNIGDKANELFDARSESEDFHSMMQTPVPTDELSSSMERASSEEWASSSSEDEGFEKAKKAFKGYVEDDFDAYDFDEELMSATFKDWLSDKVDEQSIDLTRSNFTDWLAENQVAFINLYAPWCHLCQKLAPRWEKFAQEVQKLNMPVGIAKIDCSYSAEQDLCEEQFPDGQAMAFPTFRWYENGIPTTSPYRNGHSVEAMIDFAKGKLESMEEFRYWDFTHSLRQSTQHVDTDNDDSDNDDSDNDDSDHDDSDDEDSDNENSDDENSDHEDAYNDDDAYDDDVYDDDGYGEDDSEEQGKKVSHLGIIQKALNDGHEFYYDDDDSYNDDDFFDDGKHATQPNGLPLDHIPKLEPSIYRLVEDSPPFTFPKLQQSEMSPLYWASDGEQVDEYARVIALPPSLTHAIQDFCKEIGLSKLFDWAALSDTLDNRESTITGPGDLKEGHNWAVTRANFGDSTNLHWLDVVDEQSFEATIDVLKKGGLDDVLDAMAAEFKPEGYMFAGMGFMVLSHSEGSRIHEDNYGGGKDFFNLIFPIHLPEKSVAQLYVGNETDVAPFTMDFHQGLLVSADFVHGTADCDYRWDNDYRVFASIYIADINESNVKVIADDDTALFPVPRLDDWLLKQRGRFWGGAGSFKLDWGRQPFEAQDKHKFCPELAERGLCLEKSNSDYDPALWDIRKVCTKSCGVFIEDDRYYSEVRPPPPPAMQV